MLLLMGFHLLLLWTSWRLSSFMPGLYCATLLASFCQVLGLHHFMVTTAKTAIDYYFLNQLVLLCEQHIQLCPISAGSENTRLKKLLLSHSRQHLDHLWPHSETPILLIAMPGITWLWHTFPFWACLNSQEDRRTKNYSDCFHWRCGFFNDLCNIKSTMFDLKIIKSV